MNISYIVFTADVQKEQIAKLRNAITEAVNSGSDEIYLYISSGGGNVFEGLSISAYIRALSINVITHNIGQTDSVANVIFAAGKKRYASINASFLFHGITMQLNQNMIESQVFETYKNAQRIREAISADFSKYSGLKLEDVNALMGADGGEILSATQALSKTIVHEIREPNIPKGVKVIAIGNV